MKRPSLSDNSFLQYVFSPKKHLLPVGLRRTKLVGTKGRAKGRVASYNKMSAANQEVLKRSGKRDSYLKGEVTFNEAKRALRDVAVGLGVVKPLRVRRPAERVLTDEEKRYVSDLNILAARYVATIKEATGKDANVARVMYNMQFAPPQVQYKMSRMSYSDIKRNAVDPTNIMELPDGRLWNPFWYN